MEGWPQGTLAIIEDSEEDFALFMRVFDGIAPIRRWTTAEAALVAFTSGELPLTEVGVLMVDLELPGIDGSHLIESLRGLPGGTVPIVCMLTTSSRVRDAERARASGADAFFTKPARVADLRALPGRIADVAADR